MSNPFFKNELEQRRQGTEAWEKRNKPQSQFTPEYFEGVSKTAPIEGKDTDTAVQTAQEAANLRPSPEGRKLYDQLAYTKEDKEEDDIADMFKDFGKNMEKYKPNVSQASYGDIRQAIGNPVDVLEARRKALLQLLGK